MSNVGLALAASNHPFFTMTLQILVHLNLHYLGDEAGVSIWIHRLWHLGSNVCLHTSEPQTGLTPSAFLFLWINIYNAGDGIQGPTHATYAWCHHQPSFGFLTLIYVSYIDVLALIDSRMLISCDSSPSDKCNQLLFPCYSSSYLGLPHYHSHLWCPRSVLIICSKIAPTLTELCLQNFIASSPFPTVFS